MADNPLENTDAENMATILQNLVKATQELRNDNTTLHRQIEKLSSHLIQDDEGNPTCLNQRRQHKRKKASKECQVRFL